MSTEINNNNNNEVNMNKVTTCCMCGQIIDNPEEDSIIVDGNRICKDCIDDCCCKCQRCGDYIMKQNAITFSDGSETITYCDWCANRYLWRCDNCGEWYHETECHADIHTGDGIERWCDDCVNNEDDYIYTCDGCNEYFIEGAVTYMDYGCYCPECYHLHRQDEYNNPKELDISPIKVYDYHYHKNMPLNFYGTNTKKFFGIELETCEGDNKLIDVEKLLSFKDEFFYEHDGSLGDNDRECISHPRSIESWNEFYRSGRMDEFCGVLNNAGFISEDWHPSEDEYCGLHIHVSKDYFESWRNSTVKLAALMCIVWYNVVVKIANRGDCYYSSHIISGKFSSVWRNLCGENNSYGFDDMINETKNHRCAINTQNNKTIEFRFNRGTLIAKDLIAKIQFVNYLVEYDKYSVGELLRIIDRDDYEEKSSFIREFLSGIKEPELLAYCRKVGIN